MKAIVQVSKKQYIVNGKKYKSVEEMPLKLQKYFVDADKNGIPDILENTDDDNSTTSIKINNKEYASWDEVPKEYQKFKNLKKSTNKPISIKISSDSKLDILKFIVKLLISIGTTALLAYFYRAISL